MFKTVGALALFTASVLFGYREYFRICCRRRFFEETVSAIKITQGMLRCRCAPLDECFLQSGGIFKKAARYIEEQIPPPDAVKRAAREETLLNNEEREHFYFFADGLCAEDCAGQMANAALFESMMEGCYKKAAEEVGQRGALALRGSVLLGCAVVILLL